MGKQHITRTRNRLVILESTQSAVAEFFGVERSTVHAWIKKGMPGEPGKYDLGKIFFWLRTFGPRRSEADRDEYLRELLEDF